MKKGTVSAIKPFWPKPHFSWSQYWCFTNGGIGEYKKKYLACPLCGNLFLFQRVCANCGDIPEYTNQRMRTGKIVAEMLEKDEEQTDPTLEHLRTFLPRFKHKEFRIETVFNSVKLLSFLDGFNEPPKQEILEYKTGVGTNRDGTPGWTQARADKWEQIDFYILQVHLKYGVAPEDVPVKLVWMPTEWKYGEPLPRPTGEFTVFKTSRNSTQCFEMGRKIVQAWKELGIECAKVYQKSNF